MNLRIRPSGFSGQYQSRLYTGCISAGNICIEPVTDHQGFLFGKRIFPESHVHHIGRGFSDITGYLSGGIGDHLADGAAVRYIAEGHRADQIRVGGQKSDRSGLKNAAGVRQLLIGELAVVGSQHEGDIWVIRICGNADSVSLQF